MAAVYAVAKKTHSVHVPLVKQEALLLSLHLNLECLGSV